MCVNGTPYTPSICSYGGPFDISVDTAFKEPTKNSMNITYIIEPSAPFLVMNGYSTNMLNYVNFPGKDITIRHAELIPEKNELFIQLDYSEHLQDS